MSVTFSVVMIVVAWAMACVTDPVTPWVWVPLALAAPRILMELWR